MRPTICLVMIFRNEENFLWETIHSAAGYIDYALFLDSDSDDQSRHQIHLAMGSIGLTDRYEIHNFDQPFRGDTKRTKAIDLAKGKADYLLVLDADNTITPQYIPELLWKDLTADAYQVTKLMGSTQYPILCLFRGDIDWQYTGVIHDYPHRKDRMPFTEELLAGLVINEPVKDSGPRMKTKEHYFGDAMIIERELYDNGKKLSQLEVLRYTFYLGNSYKDAGMIDRALDAYRTRVIMGGWEEEIFYSLLMIARLRIHKGDPPHEIAVACVAAWNYRPQRLEAAYLAMTFFLDLGFPFAAWSIGTASKDLPCNDKLFLEMDTYNIFFPELMKQLDEKYLNVYGSLQV